VRVRKGFTLIELLVVIAIIALLMSILMPALKRVKDQARTVGCLANLKQWGFICAMYTEDNDGKFWSGVDEQGYYWPWQLEERYKDWKQNKIWFCPTATKPIIDEHGNEAPTLNIFNAWGIYRGNEGGYRAGINGIAGSYGINGYVLTIPVNGIFEGGRAAADGWRTPNVAGAANVPLFVDALRFDLWPLATNTPADNEIAAWATGPGNNMARCCINRHNGYVGCLFLDYAVRKVGLKELWTLKWHKSFNTTGPWTSASGVQSSDWPEWIRPMKDY